MGCPSRRRGDARGGRLTASLGEAIALGRFTTFCNAQLALDTVRSER